MPMAVVQIRPMGMGVCHGVVVVPMRVFDCGIQPIVIMCMMSVVMAMVVGMTQGGMIVRMGMAFDQQQGNPRYEQQRVDPMNGVQRFAE